MAIVDLKTPKTLDLPTPENIKDLETKGMSKKLMGSLDGVHKKIHEDLKTIWRLLAGLDAMANAFNMGSQLINNVLDPVSNQDAATKKWINDNFLNIANTTAFTPDANYEPATKKYVDDNVGDMNYANTRFKIGTFTHDLSDTGDEDSPSIGFDPKVVIFLAAVSSSEKTSVGFGDGTAGGFMLSLYGGNTLQYHAGVTYSIYIYTGSGVEAGATIAMGTDKFTLTWTKTGSPTGTLSVVFLAFR